MKLPKYIISAAALLTLAACCIAEDDRYIEMPTIEVNRAVLLADFTGQQCSNCPLAHRSIESLEHQYGASFIPVSIHAGKQSISINNTRYVGLATPAGEEYDKYFGIAPLGYPSVVVDFSPSLVFGGAATTTQWIDEVRNAMQRNALVEIACNAEVTNDAEGNPAIKIATSITGAEYVEAKLMLWILEDGITSIQMGDGINFPQRDNEYIHNNVFRAAANGLWGTDIKVEHSETIDVEPTIYTLADGWEQTWNLDNLSIVAFVYTPTDGSLQATKVKVVNNTAK